MITGFFGPSTSGTDFPSGLSVQTDEERREADELHSLLALTRELAAVGTIEDLRRAMDGPLRPLLPSRDISVLTRSADGWDAIIGPSDAQERRYQYTWTSLVAGNDTVGMLGMGAPSDGAARGRLARGAATLLGLAIQNILTQENLRQDSVRDSLTGCFTRRHALEVLESEMRRAGRTGLPVSIMMMDVDGFKGINDRYGHIAGDAVLAAIGAQLQRMLRQSDVRCRLGGDELLVILPDTTADAAKRVAESVRQEIQRMVVASPRGTVKITTSIGVAAIAGKDVDVAAFIDRADVALYRAKEGGRNRVVVSAASTRLRVHMPRLVEALSA
jgi:diguanylate cyclase (GGDEF)-like protein